LKQAAWRNAILQMHDGDAALFVSGQRFSPFLRLQAGLPDMEPEAPSRMEQEWFGCS